MVKPKYETPKGTDELIIAQVPGSPVRLINWNGFIMAAGGNFAPTFLNEICGRINDTRANIIVVTGPAGEGKTYCAIRLAQILDPKFDPQIQIVFAREHYMQLVGANSPLKHGQVMIIDEAQYAAGSRRWYEEIQKDMMESIESVRSQGYVIIIVALHINLLDIIVRKYVLNYMIHISKRGWGAIYRLYTPKFQNKMYHPRIGFIRLLLPDYEKCAHPDCLRCKYMDRCLTVRAIYERRKKAFLNERTKHSTEKIKARQQKERQIPDKILVETLHKHHSEIARSTHGRLDLTGIQILLKEKHDIDIGYKAKYIRGLFEHKYPKLKVVKESSAT